MDKPTAAYGPGWPSGWRGRVQRLRYWLNPGPSSHRSQSLQTRYTPIPERIAPFFGGSQSSRPTSLRSNAQPHETTIYGLPAETVLTLIYEARREGRLR